MNDIWGCGMIGSKAAGARARHGKLIAFAATVVAFAISAAPASAIMVKLPNGHFANYDAMTGAKAPAAARNFDATFTNLDYSGGPIMPSSTQLLRRVAALQLHRPHAVSEQRRHYTYDYLGGVQQVLRQDMAADSGQATNSDAVSTQYNDTTGARSAYSFHYNDATNSRRHRPAADQRLPRPHAGTSASRTHRSRPSSTAS